MVELLSAHVHDKLVMLILKAHKQNKVRIHWNTWTIFTSKWIPAALQKLEKSDNIMFLIANKSYEKSTFF